MPRGVRKLNTQAASSSIAELLRDPQPRPAPTMDPSTPSRKNRPATAPTLANVHISDVLNGESERTTGTHLRRLHGCDVHAHDGTSTRTSRKNITSTSESEMVYRKGRATVHPGQNEATYRSTNIVIQPNSGREGGMNPKRMYGRITHHNGDIIRAPPSVEWEDKRRAKNAQAGITHKSRRHHGDIISGRDQNVSQGTGKSKSVMGVSMSNQGTHGLLHWNEHNPSAAPSNTVSGGRAYPHGGKNQSSQMMDAMSGTARTPKTAPQPGGQTLIDRLALGTAYAVIAPRNMTQGKGVADLNI